MGDTPSNKLVKITFFVQFSPNRVKITHTHTHTRARVHRPTYHQSLTLTGRTSLDQSQADVDGLENTLFNAHLDFDLPVTYKTQMRPLAGRLTTHRAAGPAGK